MITSTHTQFTKTEKEFFNMSRGGSREGAGRKKIASPRVLLTTSVAAETKSYLEKMVTDGTARSTGKAVDMAVEALKNNSV